MQESKFTSLTRTPVWAWDHQAWRAKLREDNEEGEVYSSGVEGPYDRSTSRALPGHHTNKKTVTGAANLRAPAPVSSICNAHRAKQKPYLSVLPP